MFQKPVVDGADLPGVSAVKARSPSAPPVAAITALQASDVATRLRSGWAWVLVGLLVGLVAGSLFFVFATPRYTAEAQLLINPTDLRVVENSVTSSGAPSDANLAEVESQSRVLVSEKVLHDVVLALHLDQDREFTRPQSLLKLLFSEIGSALGVSRQPSANAPALEAYRALAKQVSARREERTYVVDLTVTTTDPRKSVAIANAVVEAYLENQASARTAAAQQATGDLSSRLEALKLRVHDAEDRVEAYKAANNIADTGGGSLISEQQLGGVSNQVIAARARTDSAKARYDQIEHLRTSGADPGAIAEAVQSPTIAGLRLQYADVVRREAELTAQLGDRHPSVVDIRAEERRMRQVIGAELERLARSAKGDYDRALADQRALVQSLDSQKGTNFATNQSLVHLRELERDVDASRVVYQAFLVRSRETSEQERMNVANVRVISEATLPEKTWPPSPMLVLALTGPLGAAAAIGLLLMPAFGGRRVMPVGRYLMEAGA